MIVIKGNFSLIESMGPSDKIGRLAADVRQVAKSDFSVIIIGRNGVRARTCREGD